MSSGKELSIDEWNEILSIPAVQDHFQLDPANVSRRIGNSIYGIKLDLASIESDSVGDVYVLYGDVMERPVLIVRHSGELLVDL